MREKRAKKRDGSLRTLVIYGIFVFVLILLSFTIRIYYLIEQSKFDGKHRFTIVVGEDVPVGQADLHIGRQESRVVGIISVEPISSSLSLLTFPNSSNLSFSDFNRKLGIIPDGYIKTPYKLSWKDTIPSIFLSFLIRSNVISTNINFYDLITLYLYTNRVPVSSVKIKEASISSDVLVFNKEASFLLKDSVISTENVSVQIINAAGESGLGSRLERVISNLGGNVVSVKTALNNEKISKIKYYGQETYTLKKLEKLLSIKKNNIEKEDIARITIIIGEDSKDTIIF